MNTKLSINILFSTLKSISDWRHSNALSINKFMLTVIDESANTTIRLPNQNILNIEVSGRSMRSELMSATDVKNRNKNRHVSKYIASVCLLRLEL